MRFMLWCLENRLDPQDSAMFGYFIADEAEDLDGEQGE
jgi:hypothetical protein